jgi:hypothetical protein
MTPGRKPSISASARVISSSAARLRFRLQVERHRALAAHHHVVPALALEAEVAAPGSVDEDHVRAHVGEQHPGERPRADRLELDNLDSLKEGP